MSRHRIHIFKLNGIKVRTHMLLLTFAREAFFFSPRSSFINVCVADKTFLYKIRVGKVFLLQSPWFGCGHILYYTDVLLLLPFHITANCKQSVFFSVFLWFHSGYPCCDYMLVFFKNVFI